MICVTHIFPCYVKPIPPTYIAQHNLHYTTLTTVPGGLYNSLCFLLCNIRPGFITGPWLRTFQTQMPGYLFKSLSLVMWYPPYVLYLFPKNLVKFLRNFTLKFLCHSQGSHPWTVNLPTANGFSPYSAYGRKICLRRGLHLANVYM